MQIIENEIFLTELFVCLNLLPHFNSSGCLITLCHVIVIVFFLNYICKYECKVKVKDSTTLSCNNVHFTSHALGVVVYHWVNCPRLVTNPIKPSKHIDPLGFFTSHMFDRKLHHGNFLRIIGRRKVRFSFFLSLFSVICNTEVPVKEHSCCQQQNLEKGDTVAWDGTSHLNAYTHFIRFNVEK